MCPYKDVELSSEECFAELHLLVHTSNNQKTASSVKCPNHFFYAEATPPSSAEANEWNCTSDLPYTRNFMTFRDDLFL